jgi:tetratricopeptide (TPR) repeat protein/SAM-dependent methyltransferase
VLQKVYPLLQAGRFVEAESALRRIVAQAPDNAEAHFLLGMCRYQQGAAHDALAPMRRAVELAPATAQFAVNFGFVLGETGALDEAERVLRGAVSRAPRDPVALNALGITLQQAGRLEEALAIFARGIAIAPRDDGLHNNYGRTLRDAGRTEQALAEIRTALSLNPANLMARLNLGNVLRDTGALADAIAAYEQVVAAAPNFNMALHNLGEALLEAGRADDARRAFGRAMRAAPAVGAHCQRFADTLAQASTSALDPDERDLAARCVARDDIDLIGIGAVAFELVAAEPRIAALIDASRLSPHEFAARVAGDDARAALADPLFLDLISRTVIPDVRAERLLTAFRRAALDRWSGGFAAGDAERWLAPLAAVALHCFITEYAFAVEDEERHQVARLADRLTIAPAEGPEAGAALALLGCYRSLRDLAWVQDFAATVRDPWVARLLRRQAIEAAEEARIGAALPAITPIGDVTSRAVQAQYEENPYPRWSALPQLVAAQPLQQKLRSLFPFLGADLPALEHPRMLIAGCGTGRHAALAAMLHPTARVLAVDLSRASLAYAARRAAELGVRNVRFAQADILEMAGLEEVFDIVDCAGVLHHLRDPLAGWRVLEGLLAPKGFMRVALYSELGRAAVVAARALIAEQGYAPDPEGIRRCRRHILALPDGHPVRPVTASPDFWSLSGCRDLLFHVQEHRFTVPMIGAALDALEMEFLGFEFDDAGARRAYRAEFPQDADACSLANWAEFEARHPQSFGAMYQFWTRRRPVA